MTTERGCLTTALPTTVLLEEPSFCTKPSTNSHGDGKTSNQIDHVIIDGKWRRSLQDFGVCRGADIFSDHHLVQATVKLKLCKLPKTGQKRMDIAKLKSPRSKKKTPYSTLADSLENETHYVNTQWDSIVRTNGLRQKQRG